MSLSNMVIKNLSDLKSHNRWDAGYYLTLEQLPSDKVLEKLKKDFTVDEAINYINELPNKYKEDSINNMAKGKINGFSKESAIEQYPYEILSIILSKHSQEIIADLNNDKDLINKQIKTTQKLSKKIGI